MIAKKDWELIKAIKNHKCCGKSDNGSSDNEQEGGGGDSGNLLMSLIPNNYPKPDLFLVHSNLGDIDVTNYNIDDLLNLSIELDENLTIGCLYENSNLSPTIANRILFELDPSVNDIIISVKHIFDGPVVTEQVNYNNKVYYNYSQQQIG